MNSWLIQFDVRMPPEQYVSRRWDIEARTSRLLRPEIEWPLSVDRWVWPSVFFSKSFRDPNMDAFATITVEPLLEGTRYWVDLGKMQAWYQAHRALAPGGVFVGIELLSEKAAEGSTILYERAGGIQCGMSLDPTVPDRVPEASALLGFDVATASRFSALADLGYTEREIGELQRLWSPRLNSFGLLSSVEDAVAFRELSDERLPEDAPFWVYALWRVPTG